ncbi:MAG TPA: VOC family protein [Streptosporangiaceae bacterium]|nr:VOC family protein [Streptosporangiaceae bacterium]
MVRIDTVVINAADARRAAEFWGEALGYIPRSEGALTLVPENGDGPAVNLDETDRAHLDLRVANAAEQQAEVERLIALGARRVEWEYPDGANFVVLADTEGNPFCVVNADGE